MSVVRMAILLMKNILPCTPTPNIVICNYSEEDDEEVHAKYVEEYDEDDEPDTINGLTFQEMETAI